MKKEFVCSVDGRSFSTQEELVSYIMREFVDEIEMVGNQGLHAIQTKIQKAFPDVTAEVSSRPYIIDRESYYRSFKGMTTIEVVLSSSTKKLQNCSFAIQDNTEDGYGWHGITDYFQTLDEALAFYQFFFEGADTFAESAYETLKNYLPDVTSCSVDEIVRSHGTADSFNEYYLQLHDKNGDLRPFGYLELDERDLYSKETLQQAINKYVQALKGKFVTEIEGVVTVGTPNYCNDHSYWHEIDGIPMKSLLRRAKKARLEIIEEKE